MTDCDYETKKLICELCRQFFDAGWVTGTGGSISIRSGEKIFMTPSGVQKERIQPDEIFTVDINGGITETPVQKTGCREPKLSDCAPLFLHAYQQRNAGAVLHSHAACCNIVTSLFEGQSEFTISHQEMIKGIDGHGYFDTLRIPIIENTAWEHELADSLGEAIAKNPKSCAVLVRRHGMYVWGNSWEQAKRHGECLHYLFDIAIRMKQLGMDFNSAPKVSVLNEKLEKKLKYVLLDIEGTTTPITFVKDTLFPYSAANMDSFLQNTWSMSSTATLVMQLKALATEDGNASVQAVALAAADLSGEETARPAATAFALLCIQQDRKVGPLKQLQGMIWEQAYKSGKIQGTVYDDLIPRLEGWEREGVRVAIYSSGSRYAQQLLFGHSTHGDLRRYFNAYFDTAVGPKQSASSYKDILLTLGVEQPSDVVFVTDILGEAQAASESGMQAVLSLRSGNAPIKEDHSFPTIASFADL